MHQLSHFFRRPGRQGVAVGAALLLMLLAANGLHTQPPLAAAGGAGPDLVLSRPDGAVVGHDLHHDQSAPLRSLPLIAPGPTNRPLVDRDGLPRLILPGPAAPDPVVQRLFHALGPPTMPGPIQNFDGLYNYWGYYPPDTNGDVGPNDYVQIVNVGFQIFNKTGATRYGPANTNTLWQGFGGVCEADNDGDPVVVYDPIADRWNISQFGVPGGTAGYHQCIAVSTSGDPTGSYYRYDFLISQTLFDDYPKLGVWPDAYYASFNMFNGNPFVGPWAVAFDRARMLAGAPASFQYFTLGNQQGTLLPADLDGASLPAAGAPEPFANFGNNTLNFWKFHVDWVTPANSTFTGPTTLATANFNQLCPRTASCVPQPSTAVGLDGLGDRLMFRLAYRNFGGYDTVVLNHSVNVGGGQAGVRWYEVRNPTGTPSLYQQGTYAPDTTSRWMGSIAMDHAGDIAVGYSASSATIYPSIRYTGRLASDPLGTLPQGEATLMAGSGSQTGTANRWGDYSDLTVDPTDDCTFWYTTEYYATTGERNWRTRIGSFKFPGCTAPPPTPTATGTRATATPTYTATPSPLPSATPCAGSQVFTGAITNTDALETGRLTRGTGISTCANVKTCPGAADTIARHYKKYTYTNTSGAAQCVTVSVVSSCGDNALLSAAYLPSFNPTNVCTNYLADMGDAGPAFSYSFNAPAGATVDVVLVENSANVGCASYTLTLNPCPVLPPATPSPTSTAPGPTATVTRTATAGPSATATGTPTSGPSATATGTPTSGPSATATIPPTPGPSATTPPTSGPSATATTAPSVTAVNTPPRTATAGSTATAGTTTPAATSTAGPSATPCSLSFTDVHVTDYFYTPVLYLACHGVISGYSNGDGTFSFRPYNNTTRAQMVKIVVLGFGIPIQTPAAGNYTFADVPPSNPFFAVIETAAAHQIVSGYACGGPNEPCDNANRPYFRPYTNVTRGQLSKIVVVGAGYPLVNPPAPGTFEDVLPGTAFYTFVETAYCHGIISGYSCGGAGEPCDGTNRPYFRQYNAATRGQIAKIEYGAITSTTVCSGPAAGP